MDSNEEQATCGKCGGRLQEGWIPEAVPHWMGFGTSARVARDAWLPGRPALRQDGYVEDRGIDWKQAVRVTAYRCRECGYLEFYARKQGEGDLPIPARGGEVEARNLPRPAGEPE